jgi:hypothetical protein
LKLSDNSMHLTDFQMTDASALVEERAVAIETTTDLRVTPPRASKDSGSRVRSMGR